MGPGGKVRRDPARDVQYTRELGEAICAAYKRDTVVMATHVVATVAFEHLRKTVGKGDLFALLNHRDTVTVDREELVSGVEKLLARLAEMEAKNEIVVAAQLRFARPRAVLDSALRAFAGYHANPVLVSRGTDLVLEDTRLLFYYQNRLAAHGVAYDALKPRR